MVHPICCFIFHLFWIKSFLLYWWSYPKHQHSFNVIFIWILLNCLNVKCYFSYFFLCLITWRIFSFFTASAICICKIIRNGNTLRVLYFLSIYCVLWNSRCKWYSILIECEWIFFNMWFTNRITIKCWIWVKQYSQDLLKHPVGEFYINNTTDVMIILKIN